MSQDTMQLLLITLCLAFIAGGAVTCNYHQDQVRIECVKLHEPKDCAL